MDLDTLNEKQKEAVMTTEGPVLVLAGAGSGKTKVLTTRIAYLIKEKKVRPTSILAITFTNKAAKEMKERVINMLGEDGFRIQISTFHSFGLLVLKQNCEKLGFSKNFTIADSEDSLTIVKRIIKDKNLDPKLFSPRLIRNKISGAKNELLSPKEYENYETMNQQLLAILSNGMDKINEEEVFEFIINNEGALQMWPWLSEYIENPDLKVRIIEKEARKK